MERREIVWPGWETGKVLGRGNFSKVYEIHRDTFGTEEKAALKVITIPQDPADIEELFTSGYDAQSVTARFRSHLEAIVGEYSLMAKLKGHPNVVYCDDLRYIQHDDGIGWDVFIKMELLTPLHKALTGEITQEQAIQVGRDICEALVLCREHGILHRDLKPQNIFMGRDGSFKLGDFGVAKAAEKTTSGTKVGTYNYMAPEVYKGQPYGPRADVYSLGLVLYWMLNQRRLPFLPLPPQTPTVSQEEEARSRRMNGEALPDPAQGSRELRRIVLKACAYDPRDRYTSAEEMLQDLLAMSEHTEGMFMGWKDREQERLRREKEERLRREAEEREKERLRQEKLKKEQEEAERKRREAEEARKREQQRLEQQRRRKKMLLFGALGVAAVLTVAALAGGKEEPEPEPTQAETSIWRNAVNELKVDETLPPAETTQETQESYADGWVEKNGAWYYYYNGTYLVGWYDIDGYTYYFRGDGVLAQNVTMDVDGMLYTFGSGGEITARKYTRLDGYWADRQFTFGDTSGTAVRVSYKELDAPVENCYSLTLNVIITDDGGGDLTGEWTSCIRINGHWKRMDTFRVSGNSGSVTLYFDDPITFDAFTAYRTAGVTRSYYNEIYLSNVAV